MRCREFVQPTPEEIEQRRAMYAQAEELGIDLLSFDEPNKKPSSTVLDEPVKKSNIDFNKYSKHSGRSVQEIDTYVKELREKDRF